VRGFSVGGVEGALAMDVSEDALATALNSIATTRTWGGSWRSW
jgi:hypothetical protein